MPFRQVLSLTRSLLSPAIAARGAAFAALVVAERLIVPAAAWSIFRRGIDAQIALAFAAGGAFGVRTFLQHASRARTEIDLLERVAARLIGGDVLRANVLRDEDARAELGQAMYHAAQNVSVVIPLLLADCVAAPVLAVVVVAKEPARLVVAAVGVAIAAGAVLLASRRSIDGALAAAWSAQQQAFSGFMDTLEGRLEIVASGRRAAFLGEMHARTAAWAKAGARVATGALVSGKLPFLLVAAAAAVVVTLAGGHQAGATGVTTADIALLASITPAFAGMAQNLVTLARTERWMGVVARALSEAPLWRGGVRPPPRLPAGIAFERVSFTYGGGRKEALRDVSFLWNGERVLALTGANGSGKSTCLRLLLALAEPESGAITVGGSRLAEIDADAWRRGVAFLPQRPYLPPQADVRGAVRFLVPEASDDAIRVVLDRVGLSPALERLGADPLAVRVGALSVGQRQRVGIARLLCQPASLVLLDEPDANLDRAGIALMAALVRELSRHGMVALVAHHVDLLEVADRVLVLEDGRLVADEAPGVRAVRDRRER
jgi:ATP-binding cassette subfamily C protein CydCD